jgi:hypothetical protein
MRNRGKRERGTEDKRERGTEDKRERGTEERENEEQRKERMRNRGKRE